MAVGLEGQEANGKVSRYVLAGCMIFNTLRFTKYVETLALAARQAVKTSYYPHQIAYQNMQNCLSFLQYPIRIGQR